MKAVQAGRLRHRITIQEMTTLYDSDNNIDDQTWVSIAEAVPAEITDVSARELFAAQAAQSRTTTRIKIRYRPDLKTLGMRIVHRSEVYDIQGIIDDPDSRQRYQTLLCSSGANEG